MGMIPEAHGQRLTFYAGGLYEGLVVMRDRETRSVWNHITGECLKGGLAGVRLPLVPLLHFSAEDAHGRYPTAHLAYSRLTLFQRVVAFFTEANRVYAGRFFFPFFKKTLSTIDRRRPSWELGLGVWVEGADGVASARYYPKKTLRRLDRSGRGLIDELSGRKLMVYYDGRSGIPGAILLSAPDVREATQARRDDDGIVLDTGAVFREGSLYDTGGAPLFAPRPMQLFTRWYGFAATFPGCDVYGE